MIKKMLKNDDDAGNAIEEAIKVVEDCPYYKSVGYGGLPPSLEVLTMKVWKFIR